MVYPKGAGGSPGTVSAESGADVPGVLIRCARRKIDTGATAKKTDPTTSQISLCSMFALRIRLFLMISVTP